MKVEIVLNNGDKYEYDDCNEVVLTPYHVRLVKGERRITLNYYASVVIKK